MAAKEVDPQNFSLGTTDSGRACAQICRSKADAGYTVTACEYDTKDQNCSYNMIPITHGSGKGEGRYRCAINVVADSSETTSSTPAPAPACVNGGNDGKDACTCNGAECRGIPEHETQITTCVAAAKSVPVSAIPGPASAKSGPASAESEPPVSELTCGTKTPDQAIELMIASWRAEEEFEYKQRNEMAFKEIEEGVAGLKAALDKNIGYGTRAICGSILTNIRNYKNLSGKKEYNSFLREQQDKRKAIKDNKDRCDGEREKIYAQLDASTTREHMKTLMSARVELNSECIVEEKENYAAYIDASIQEEKIHETRKTIKIQQTELETRTLSPRLESWCKPYIYDVKV